MQRKALESSKLYPVQQTKTRMQLKYERANSSGTCDEKIVKAQKRLS